ncbi:amino acid ABC transporter permease [Acuticoccus sp. I52.16.1]|uniref:amino acid ABC transporter permease n=1 Tax=Acuticoccus sp. I52.16.1 TaxID=2928472 RepID=UPI001FD38912|nr:amino acid ABC transporter permease [Acuticoccus sp. I52.16.1]UOM34733.1 amino acid ABC transporter permease [Acuticoccus sp. I52.16.1]
MSGTHAETVAYVADTQFAPQPAPVSTSGVVGWLRENLFSSWLNSALTIACLAFVAWLLPSILEWALFNSVWNAGSLSECREIIANTLGEGESGACWAVINERFGQLMYGFYPISYRWRPNLALLLLFIAIAPVLFQTLRPLALGLAGFLAAKVAITLIAVLFGAGDPEILVGPTTFVAIVIAPLAYFFGHAHQKRYWLWFSLAYPVICYVLLVGGVLLRPVTTDQFGGFLLTLVIGITGIAASFPIGILLALGRQSNLPILKIVCVTFIEFVRGVPLITLLFVASVLLNYFLPPGTNFDKILRVIIMVTLFASAYMAEVVRGGLAALPRGQYEAADAMGLTYWQSMRLIILPQALKISIPGIVNTFIGLFKDTTLVSIIALFDPIGIINPIRADSDWNGIVWELYGFIAFVFFICCWSMSRYSIYLENRLRAADAR